MSTRRIKALWAVCALVAAIVLTPHLLPAQNQTRLAPRQGDEKLFSIEVREADISDVLRALAQQSGLNIILGDGVTGKVSLSFRNIPFQDAMEMVIKANGLMYTVQNNILWVGKKVDVSDEMRVEIIGLNNADPAIAVQQLKGIITENGTSFADQRTNSVIIRDLPRNIEQAKKLLMALDTQAAQVVIEARIVEASNNFARQLGVRWGPTYASGSGRNTVGGSSLLPATPSGDRNFAVNLPATNPTAGLGIVLGSISDRLFLDLELSAAETRGDLKIVSSPRISTVNNKPATIHSGLTFRVKLSQAIVSGGGATTTSGDLGGLEEIKTGIDLTVTPKISDDGFVLLDINTQKSDPDFSRTIDGIPGVAEKSASTFVLAKDGETVVIGGLYRTLSSSQKNEVPFLSKVPLLGYLFRSSGRDEQHEELLVFITPRIVRYEKTREVLN